MTPDDAASFQAAAERIAGAVNSFLHGKADVVSLAMTCLLAEGHLLLEDVPGVGKTSLARSLASALGAPWQRIQFTPDLLPGDVTGVSVCHQANSSFVFHPGPVVSNVVLADEINRPAPRTQSGLLEVMEECQVTVDGRPYPVPRPHPLAGLGTADPEFTARASRRLDDSMLSAGILVLASHGDVLLKEPCTDAVWLQAGGIVAMGMVDDVSLAITTVIQSPLLFDMVGFLLLGYVGPRSSSQVISRRERRPEGCCGEERVRRECVQD